MASEIGKLHIIRLMTVIVMFGCFSKALFAGVANGALINTTTVHCQLFLGSALVIPGYPNRQCASQYMFDSGSNRSVIARSIVRALHLEEKVLMDKNNRPMISALDSKPERYVVISQFQIGELIIENLQCTVVDDNQLRYLTGLNIAGILGSNLLRSTSVCIDFRSNSITFINHVNMTAQDLVDLQMDKANFTSLRFNTLNLPTISALLQEDENVSSEDFVVDTGAKTTNISVAVAQKLKLQGRYHVQQSDVMVGNQVLNFDIVDSIVCDRLTMKNLSVYFPVKDSTPGASSHLGLDFLTNYSILFDAGGGKLYFKFLRPD